MDDEESVANPGAWCWCIRQEIERPGLGSRKKVSLFLCLREDDRLACPRKVTLGIFVSSVFFLLFES